MRQRNLARTRIVAAADKASVYHCVLIDQVLLSSTLSPRPANDTRVSAYGSRNMSRWAVFEYDQAIDHNMIMLCTTNSCFRPPHRAMPQIIAS